MAILKPRIVPHLWFDKEAKEAAEFYASVFPDSRVTNITTLHDTPSGDCDVVSFELSGQPFMAISAGPLFKFNESISFIVYCETQDEIDYYWEKLSAVPEAEQCGWLKDKYGLSWQIMHAGDQAITQKITPSLLFVGDVAGKAEEAITFYTSLFPDSQINMTDRYEGDGPDATGTIRYASFQLAGDQFAAMDSAMEEHKFAFNEAISFMVYCEDQKEIDKYWDAMSAVPESEQCGWIKDKFGVSWQIVPTGMDEMLSKGTKEQIAAVTESFLQMKKFDIAELQRAYESA